MGPRVGPQLLAFRRLVQRLLTDVVRFQLVLMGKAEILA